MVMSATKNQRFWNFRMDGALWYMSVW